MKRSTLFPLAIILGLTLCCCTGGITRSHKFVYDMANDQFYTSTGGGLTVEQGDLVSLELTNINPFVYDVTINQRFVSSPAAVPTLQKLPTWEVQIAESVPQTLVLNVDNSGRVNVAAISRFGDVYTDFRRQYLAFGSFVSFDEYLYSTLKRAFVDEKAFKEELQNRLVDVAGGSRLYTRTDFVNKGEELYGALSVAYTRLANEYRLLDSTSKNEVRNIFTNASMVFNGLSARNIWTSKVTSAADVYTLVQSTPFKMSSFRTQADGDVVRFVIEGERKSAPELGQLDNVKAFDLQYSIKVNRGWKIDFSSGLFVSNLVNESYTTKDENNRKIILKEKGDVATYGPGVAMHFYYQPFGLGANLGLFTNNFANVQYIVGPSVLLGNDNRFCINGGVTLGKVKRLADGLQAGTALVSTDNSLSVVPTTDRLEVGWYAGFSYNFTSGF